MLTKISFLHLKAYVEYPLCACHCVGAEIWGMEDGIFLEVPSLRADVGVRGNLIIRAIKYKGASESYLYAFIPKAFLISSSIKLIKGKSDFKSQPATWYLQNLVQMSKFLDPLVFSFCETKIIMTSQNFECLIIYGI